MQRAKEGTSNLTRFTLTLRLRSGQANLHTTPRFSFTLVEVAVVITIIALLAAFSIPQMSRMRANARDSQRMADLHTIQVALTMYYATYGYYPKILSWAVSGHLGSSYESNWTNLQTALAPYLGGGILPSDPLETGDNLPFWNNNYHYVYASSTDGQVYDLVCQLESKNNENTCQYKCWHNHLGWSPHPPESPWCSPCPGEVVGCSLYMYADH